MRSRGALSRPQIDEVAAKYCAGATLEELAHAYRVSRTAIKVALRMRSVVPRPRGRRRQPPRAVPLELAELPAYWEARAKGGACRYARELRAALVRAEELGIILPGSTSPGRR